MGRDRSFGQGFELCQSNLVELTPEVIYSAKDDQIYLVAGKLNLKLYSGTIHLSDGEGVAKIKAANADELKGIIEAIGKNSEFLGEL